MKLWNEVYIKVRAGSDAYIKGQIELWRNESLTKDQIYDSIKHELSVLEDSLEILNWVRGQIEKKT